MRIHKLFIGLISLLAVKEMSAQDQQTITVTGTVFDKLDSTNAIIPIIVNRRTGSGMTAAPGDLFTLGGFKTDTFEITAGGYEMLKICFVDSIYKPTYLIRVGLSMKENYLSSVTIHPVKDLQDIQRERSSIGATQTYTAVGTAEAFASPITFLYERYSREGKSRAFVAMMENEDKKKEILKELFRTYNLYGVIDLKEDEFDTFINYLNMPETTLRSSSDFALATYIREKYITYENAKNYHLNNQR